MREEVLILADEPVIAALSLLQEVQVLFKLLLAGEGDRVDPLQTVICHLSKPVGSRVFHHFESLDELSGGDVWPSAEIDQITTTIRCDTLSIFDLAADRGNLEWIGLKQVQSLFLSQDKALEDLFLAGDLFGAFVNRFVVFLGEFLYVI